IFSNLLLQENWRVRFDGCQELLTLLSGPVSLPALLPHLPQLLQILETLRHDSNFQVVNASLQVINTVIKVLGPSITPHVPALLWCVVRHVGDPRVMVR
ncbi:Armadillo-type fold, partial [Trinorchestia longiramus]